MQHINDFFYGINNSTYQNASGNAPIVLTVSRNITATNTNNANIIQYNLNFKLNSTVSVSGKIVSAGTILKGKKVSSPKGQMVEMIVPIGTTSSYNPMTHQSTTITSYSVVVVALVGATTLVTQQ
jgi:hypothetical protein